MQCGGARPSQRHLLSAKSTGLPKDSVANVTQIVTLDEDYLVERTGRVHGRLISSGASTPGGSTSTRSDPTRLSTTRPPLRSMSPPLGPFLPSSSPLSTQLTSKSERSPPTVAFDGTPPGSTSLISSVASTSDSKRSPPMSGPSLSVPSRSAGSTPPSSPSLITTASRRGTLDDDLSLRVPPRFALRAPAARRIMT